MKKIMFVVMLFTATVFVASASGTTFKSFANTDKTSPDRRAHEIEELAGFIEGTFTPPGQYENTTEEELEYARMKTAEKIIKIVKKEDAEHDGRYLNGNTLTRAKLPAFLRAGAKSEGTDNQWMGKVELDNEKFKWLSLQYDDNTPTGNCGVNNRLPYSDLDEAGIALFDEDGEATILVSDVCFNPPAYSFLLTGNEKVDTGNSDPYKKESTVYKSTDGGDVTVVNEIYIEGANAEANNYGTGGGSGSKGSTCKGCTTKKTTTTKTFLEEENSVTTDCGTCGDDEETIACTTCRTDGAWNRKDVAFVEEQLAMQTAQNAKMIKQLRLNNGLTGAQLGVQMVEAGYQIADFYKNGGKCSGGNFLPGGNTVLMPGTF